MGHEECGMNRNVGLVFYIWLEVGAYHASTDMLPMYLMVLHIRTKYVVQFNGSINIYISFRISKLPRIISRVRILISHSCFANIVSCDRYIDDWSFFSLNNHTPLALVVGSFDLFDASLFTGLIFWISFANFSFPIKNLTSFIPRLFRCEYIFIISQLTHP